MSDSIMPCIECDGEGHTFYGAGTYAVCEICGGVGYLDSNARKLRGAPSTPLWPVHDHAALKARRGKG